MDEILGILAALAVVDLYNEEVGVLKESRDGRSGMG